jgi:hypothetical protein
MGDQRYTRWQLFWKRRRFLVDPKLQLGLVWHSLGLVLLTQAVVLLGILVPLVQELQHDANNPMLGVDEAVVLLHVHDSIWWIVLLSIVLPVISALHVSHRIAGPMVRFRRDLRQLAAGSLPAPLHPRARDQLQTEIALWNEVLATLSARHQRLTDIAQVAARAVTSINAASPGDVEALLLATDSLTEISRELQSLLPAPAVSTAPAAASGLAAPAVQVGVGADG